MSGCTCPLQLEPSMLENIGVWGIVSCRSGKERERGLSFLPGCLSRVGFTEAYIKHNYIFDWRQPQHSCWVLNPSSHISASWLWCLKCTLNYVSKAVDARAVRIFLTALDFFLLPSFSPVLYAKARQRWKYRILSCDRPGLPYFLNFLDTQVVPYRANKQILSLNVPIFTHFEVRSLAKTLHLWW